MPTGAEQIAALAGLVPALPLAAAAAVGLRRLLRTLPATVPVNDAADAAERLTAGLAQGAAWLALLIIAGLDLVALGGGLPPHVALGDWFVVGTLRLPVSFMPDPLALAIGTLWALLGALAVSFSVRYLHREPGFHRFFLGLLLFIGGMLLIVLAGNAALAFVGWELAGLSSWLLIGYAQERPTATGNALRAFVTNRVGDAAFLMGIGFAALWIGGLDWPAIARGAAQMETVPAGLLAIGFIVAALVKSAQFPFSPWLARALEGPTPSSAIFYGSLLVHAGVFLLLRLEGVLRHVPELMIVIAAIGLVTTVYAALCGFVQTDVKSSLMFATLTQVGLMFLACGAGWFTLAAWHLALHAIWRAWQFLMAPSWLLLSDAATPPVAAWLARRQTLYAAALQRFWLEKLGDILLAAPTRRLGRDMDSIDERILRPTLGLPAAPGDGAAARGLATTLLAAVADRLGRFERHLLVHGREGRAAHALSRLGDYLTAVELLIEEPRYMYLFIMATLVVIL